MDGLVSSVGTANMDIRSFEQNFEVNLIIYDRNVSRQLGSDFLDDLKGSSEISIHRCDYFAVVESFTILKYSNSGIPGTPLCPVALTLYFNPCSARV